ncbi:hypothetical protein RIR_jg23595.t1 [Rhizophagus irregularis DAOM 181602=DAOM 197198]|nr:hypothetical protein RIR_jg23595.t1 [Rhizophagus irregularis DAOM 181602=DAOM 197198]
MRHSISKIYGTEAIPDQLLKPSYLRKDHNEILGFMDLQINQYAKLQIGSEIFRSVVAGCHETNSTILAK